MEGYSILGKRLPRIDGVEKVSGRAKFTDDLVLPRMLYGKIFRSPYPHAKILNTDTSKAKRLPGVKAIITSKEIGSVMTGWRTPERPSDRYLLVIEKTRFIGEEVAAIAAVDEDTAEEALELIRVEYEELPGVFDPEKAMEPTTPRIHEHKENNISGKVYFHYGDVEKGFLESDYVHENWFVTQATCHSAMELHNVLADCDPTSGSLMVWGSTQSPYIWNLELSEALRLPFNKARVGNPHVGSGFGSKAEAFPLVSCAAFLSKIVERPVKINLTREEVMLSARQRHPMILTLKTGVKRDGTIVATQCKNIADGGAYDSIGVIALYLAGAFWASVYKLPKVKYEGYRVYTNKTPKGPQRGHAHLQPRFAADCQMDRIAEELGIDPVEIRLKNALKVGDVLPNKEKLTSCGLTECIQKATESVDWKRRRKEKQKNVGIGIGCSSFVTGALFPPYTFSGAMIKIHPNGGVTLLAGIPEIGQGSDTMVAQVVAEELGISIQDVTVVSSDTGVTPPHPGSYSNRGTLWAGSAAKFAATDAKRQLFQLVAEKLEVSAEDLEAKNHRIYVKGSPDKGMDFKDAVMACFVDKESNPILGKGYYRPPIDIVQYETAEGLLTPAHSFTAQIAEVNVDPETGQAKVSKIVATHDCGVAINPMAVEGQMEGGISMGQGQVLLEEVLWDGGLNLNPSFLDYKLPTALETPEIKLILIETLDPELPLGAKTGEGVVVSILPAIANAIYNATGAKINELPITPEKILEAFS